MARFYVAILIVSTLLSLPDTQSTENTNFSKALFCSLTVKNTKGTWWCSPYSLQRLQTFSASDLASLRLSLDLQTPLKTMHLKWSSGKRRAFSLEFSMFWRIIHLMLLTVASALSASQGELIDSPVISLSPLFCTRFNFSTRLLLIQGCRPPTA